MNILVENLSHKTTKRDLETAFGDYGQIEAINMPMDNTGRSKGYAYLDMPDNFCAQIAIQDLHCSEIDGNTIKVTEAIEGEGHHDGG